MTPKLPISPKRLIIMCGHPGAGKTTTAHRIRQALDDAIVISRDYFRNHDRWNGRIDEYSNWKATIVDRVFYGHVEKLLPFYTTIILDATYRDLTKRQVGFDFAQKHGCQFFVIECLCSYQILLQRLQRQMDLGHKRFIKRPEEVLEYYIKSKQEPKDELKDVNLIKIDTENNKIVLKSLQDQSCQFVKQLIEILEQSFDPSLLEPFCTIPYYENG